MDKPTGDLQQEILSLRNPSDLLSQGTEYRAGFRAGYEEARREIAALVGERGKPADPAAIVVDGHEIEIGSDGPDKFYITAKDCDQFLRHNGEWDRMFNFKECYWPTRAAAEAFARDVAGRGAAG